MAKEPARDEGARPTTVFGFRLPRGYLAADGAVHADGAMRLATVADELAAARDPRVLKQAPYLPVALVSRVVTRLGTLEAVTPDVIEGLFASDFAYLRQLYEQLNLEAFVDQYEEGKEGAGRVAEVLATHPWLPKRVKALRLFAQSRLYREHIGQTGGLRMEQVDERVHEIIKVLG